MGAGHYNVVAVAAAVTSTFVYLSAYKIEDSLTLSTNFDAILERWDV